MTDGMVTRSQALEEQLSSLSYMIAKQDAKMDAMSISVQQHSDTFKMLHKSLSSQQSVMEHMMVKLAKLDKAPLQPPMLPLPVTSPQLPIVPSQPQPFAQA